MHTHTGESAGTPAPPYLRTSSVAALLGVDRRTVVRLIDRHALRAVRVGRVWRVERASLEAYLRAQGNVQELEP